MNSVSYLTPLEVAKLLKITKNTVYELIKRGELPAYKVGNKLRIDSIDVDNYINNKKHNISLKNQLSRNNYNQNINDISDNEIIISGQDIILDVLVRHLEKNITSTNILRSHLGSYNALYELYNNRVSIASSHLFDGETNTYNTTFVKKLIPGVPCTIINLAYRYQGFYVASGNPKNINLWEDLTNPSIKFINREKGSGTRILLDQKLNLLNIDPSSINGYNNEENSHLSIASTVSRGHADVGLGNEKASLQVNKIDFLPLQKEQYDLIIKKEDLKKPIYKEILNIIKSDEFKSDLEGIGGYDLTDLGKIIE